MCGLTHRAIVLAAADQVSCAVGTDAAILQLSTGVYYTVNPAGSRVWQLLARPITVGEILDMLLAEYDVEPARCERDLLALLERLAAEGLIDVRDETAA